MIQENNTLDDSNEGYLTINIEVYLVTISKMDRDTLQGELESLKKADWNYMDASECVRKLAAVRAELRKFDISQRIQWETGDRVARFIETHGNVIWHK